MVMMPSGYYNRFNKDDKYEKHLFIAGRSLQSAELNEIQDVSKNRIKTVGDAVFKDGQVITDAVIEVDKETGVVTCHAGTVYVRGEVRAVPSQTLTIPKDGDYAIGVKLIETVINARTDSNLRDPAVGMRNYQKEGASRLKVTTAWTSNAEESDDAFYPIYYVRDCEIIRNVAKSEIEISLAQYDRDSAGGTYVTTGMSVNIEENSTTQNQTFVISKGKARVYGWSVVFPADRRISFSPAPTTNKVVGESHTATGGSQRINVYTTPVASVDTVLVKVKRTYQMTRGITPNTADLLPNNSVSNIISISGYTLGTDFKLTGNSVDWSLGGNEPSSGSTYSVVYEYWKSAEVTNVDGKGFTVTDNVSAGDGNIIATYDYYVPRVDRLCIDKEGDVVFVKGLSSDYNPRATKINDDLLCLALIYQTWDSNRYVTNDGARMVSMSELSTIQTKLDRVLTEVAQNKLILDASMRETALKKQIFVDPLTDDSFRDSGIEQDAIIYDEQLMLNIPLTSDYLGNPSSNTLTGSLVVEIDQPLKTGSMKINGYMSYVPEPISASLNPAVDRWTTTVVVDENGYYSPKGWAYGKQALQKLLSKLVNISMWEIGRQTVGYETAQLLREISVAFSLKGLQPNEVCSVKFDGITVTTSPETIRASTTGVASGSFTIPANVKAGTKQVDFMGQWGSVGKAYFQGSGTVEKVVVSYGISDPLSQTFRVTEKCQVGAVDIWINKLGTTPITVQIRSVENGYPTSEVLAEKTIEIGSLSINRFNRFTFDLPVTVSADTDYSITVMCNDSVSEVAIAELGKLDQSIHQYVTSQAYQVGVLFSSSNGVTWTAHQGTDMTFRLLKYSYETTTKTINLGAITVSDTTDMVVLGVEEIPEESTRIDYRITFPDGSTSIVSSDQAIKLSAKVSGSVSVQAILYGTDSLSPVLYGDNALLHGCIKSSCDYITRAIPTYNASGSSCRVRIIYETDLPEGSDCKTYIKGIDEGDSWQEVTQIGTMGLSDGWIERTFQATDVSENALHLKLSLSGNTVARPSVRNIRFMVM